MRVERGYSSSVYEPPPPPHQSLLLCPSMARAPLEDNPFDETRSSRYPRPALPEEKDRRWSKKLLRVWSEQRARLL